MVEDPPDRTGSRRDPATTLIELLAYVGDALSSYQDRVAAEAALRSRRRRLAIVLGALLIPGYRHRRRWGGPETDEAASRVEPREATPGVGR
jgi:hypothetical protein